MQKRTLFLLFIGTSFSIFAMEAPESQKVQFAELPAELKVLIISAGVQQAKTLQEAVDQIKAQAQVNKVFRDIIQNDSPKFINYLANKFHVSDYKIAFTLGVLSKEWFINKGLMAEGEELNKEKLQQLAATWKQTGKALIDNVKQKNKQEVVRLLTEGADHNFIDVNGKTPLHWASFHANKDIVTLLLGNGADPNTKDDEDWTALHRAVIKGNKDIATLLLGNRADPNTKDNNGMPALHWAVIKGRKDIVTLLLGNGADPNAKDKKGGTALHRAIIEDNKDIATLLLGNGADPNIKDNYGRAALDLASEGFHTEIIKMLEEAIAKWQVNK